MSDITLLCSKNWSSSVALLNSSWTQQFSQLLQTNSLEIFQECSVRHLKSRVLKSTHCAINYVEHACPHKSARPHKDACPHKNETQEQNCRACQVPQLDPSNIAVAAQGIHEVSTQISKHCTDFKTLHIILNHCIDFKTLHSEISVWEACL